MINSNLYYTPREVIVLAQAGYFPVRSRATLTKLIKSGKLKVVNYGTNTRPFYKIKGEELIRFNELGDIGSSQIDDEKKKEMGVQEQGTDSS